ncbi:hypothetical protein LWI29_005664 [Acer saccharum]|uniref:Retrotransposon gag domain-containing protein n=1 Tax=Acer saccharum TaxID=4024 RepID=A0AA39RQ26_ACESA|nr:hypothetical protein LWI29_005664 [Acer saccharum]
MIVAAAYLTGDTIPWYQWLERTIGNLTWVQFTKALATRFGKLEEADPGGALSKLRQNGTVKEYQLGARTQPLQQLPDGSNSAIWEWKPEAILSRGAFKRDNRAVTKLLVQWQNLPKDEATWEDYYDFVVCFPDFQLEDKLP